MPKGELLRLRYTESGMMEGYAYEMNIETHDNGDVVLRAMRESYGMLYEKRLDAAAMDSVRRIIEEEQMYAYAESYRPTIQVMDGYMWHFRAEFADSSFIQSGGSNARPHGNGLEKLRAFATELLKDAEVVEDKEK